jgi:hypothetical protein
MKKKFKIWVHEPSNYVGITMIEVCDHEEIWKCLVCNYTHYSSWKPNMVNSANHNELPYRGGIDHVKKKHPEVWILLTYFRKWNVGYNRCECEENHNRNASGEVELDV